MNRITKRKRYPFPTPKAMRFAIPFGLLSLVVLYLALFRLPWFTEEKLSTVTGVIRNVSVTETFGNHGSHGERGYLAVLFEFVGTNYYLPLPNPERQYAAGPLEETFQEIERAGTPVTIQTTTETDFSRHLLRIPGKRELAISMTYGDQTISSHDYRNWIAHYRVFWLAAALFFGGGALLETGRDFYYNYFRLLPKSKKRGRAIAHHPEKKRIVNNHVM